MNNKDNPCGLQGFAFLEFSAIDGQALHHQFEQMGFVATAKHKDEAITLFQQGGIQFIVNQSQNSQPAEHAKVHGTGACAMGFRVTDASKAHAYVLSKGAVNFTEQTKAKHGLPAIEAIGGSVIYFVDDTHQPFADQWQELPHAGISGHGLVEIDHLTHNVYKGNMDKWADFYTNLFNFREIRFFNIEGQMTGLFSRAMSSPCDKIKIPLNESKDDVSQIEEFLHEYKGEGIQHVALASGNIYQSVPALRSQGIPFLSVPDTYYEMISSRIPWHQEPIKDLQRDQILIDGEQDPAQGLLLQIFTENLFGPVFFEIIQRKGNQGFGEGNFQALFEAIERDQIRRGTLHVPA